MNDTIATKLYSTAASLLRSQVVEPGAATVPPLPAPGRGPESVTAQLFTVIVSLVKQARVDCFAAFTFLYALYDRGESIYSPCWLRFKLLVRASVLSGRPGLR